MSGLFSCIGGKNPLKRSKKKKQGKEPEDRKNKRKSEKVEEKDEEVNEEVPMLVEAKPQEPAVTELKVSIEEAQKVEEKKIDSTDGEDPDNKEPVSPLIKELQEKFLRMDKTKVQSGDVQGESTSETFDGESGKHNLPKNFAKNVPMGSVHAKDTELCLLRSRVSNIEKDNENLRDLIDELKSKETTLQKQDEELNRQNKMMKDALEELKMQKEALTDELDQCKKDLAAYKERDEFDGGRGDFSDLGKRLGNEDSKGTEEILEAIGQLERVCSAFEPGIEKVEKIEMADSVADMENEKLKSRLTGIEDNREEICEDITKTLQMLQELECRVISIEVSKDSEEVTGFRLSDHVVKRLSDAEESQTVLTKEVGKLTHSYSEMEMRLVQIEEEKDHLNTQVKSALSDNEQLRQTLENMSDALKQKEIALQGTIKDSTERSREMENLKTQCQSKEEELKRKTKEYQDLKSTLDNTQSKFDSLQEKYATLDKDLKSNEGASVTNAEINNLRSQCQNKDTELKEEQKSCQTLRKEMSDCNIKYEDLLKKYDNLQSQFKNGETLPPEVSATNGATECSTPTQIAERYMSELYGDKWVAAYEKLTTVCKRDEKKSLQILMDFCTEAYLHCRRTARQQIDLVWSLLTNPSGAYLRGGLSRRVSVKSPSTDTLPESLRTMVMDFRKRPSKQLVDNLYEDFMTQLDFEKSRHLRNVHDRDVNEISPYISKCLEISWEMVVQDPPMYLQFKVRHGSEVDTVKFGFYGQSGHKTDYLVWPALLRDENGTLLQKGIIQAVSERP